MAIINMRFRMSFKAIEEDSELSLLQFGGYTFKIKGMEIPFDFSSYGYDIDYDEDKNRVCIDFESGQGIVKDSTLDDCCDEKYKKCIWIKML